jgi:hypothetical protein
VTDHPLIVVGRVVPVGADFRVSPLSGAPRHTNRSVDAKQIRLIAAARTYKRERTQVALDELLDAAKDIDE